jgi:hypothetical protein
MAGTIGRSFRGARRSATIHVYHRFNGAERRLNGSRRGGLHVELISGPIQMRR